MERTPPPLPPRACVAPSRVPSPPRAPVASNLDSVDLVLDDDDDDDDDESLLAKTVERPSPLRASISITTARIAPVVLARPASIPAIAIDIAPIAPNQTDPRILAFGAAVVGACALAAIIGVAVGLSPPSRVHAAVDPARTAHVAVVVAAREEITESPLSAPNKLPATAEPAEPAPVTVAATPRPTRRSGFGHMGADRVSSAAPPAQRRATPNRR